MNKNWTIYSIQRYHIIFITHIPDIAETLRKWPPLGSIDRVCSKAYTLPPPNDSSDQEYTVILKFVKLSY